MTFAFQEQVPTEKQNLPTINLEVKSLPSKALSYPKNSTIKYRPYTFGEVKKLSQSKFTVKEKYLEVLYGIECSFDKLELTMSDLLYIGLLRNLSTIGGNKYDVPYTCHKCGKKNKETISMENIEFEDISAPELPIIAPMSFDTLEFYPLTVKQFFELVDKDLLQDSLAILAIQFKGKFEDNYKLVENCSLQDGEMFDAVDKMMYHGVKELKIKCKEQDCGNEIPVNLDGGETMILPFRESQESPANKLRFGKRTSH